MSPGSKSASASEPTLSLDTNKDKWYKGSALTSECPRAGHALMRSKKGVTMVNTNCNSWRCISCRNRNIYRFQRLVKTGMSQSTTSGFITFTYKQGSARLADAQCVSKDWRALWRIVKRADPQLSKSPWLRVMELTKKGTPHIHMVVTKLEGRRVTCSGPHFDVQQYRERLADCDCVAHTFGRAWSQVTKGESYIVHGIVASKGSGAGLYLAKYMTKTFDGERAKLLGMERRWSTSRNWEGEKRARFKETLYHEWIRTWWMAGQVELEEYQLDEEVGQKLMTEGQWAEAVRLSRAKLLKIAKEVSFD